MAVKTVVARDNDQARSSLLLEAKMLASLEGRAVPRIIESGEHDGLPYFATSWIEGVPVTVRADEIRREGRGHRANLLRLCTRVAEAFAELHAAGVLHGDVKSSNVLIDRQDQVQLIDLGMAVPTTGGDMGRSWDYESLEPEAAEQFLNGQTLAPTIASEQFAIGVLIYRMASGQPFRVPSPLQREALIMIAQAHEMPPFTSGPCEAWPELENVLRRALAPDPGQRYSTLLEFCKALRSISSIGSAAPSPKADIGRLADRMIQRVTAEDRHITDFYGEARSSIHRGAAGLAWFLYRAAQIRQDGVLLAHADRWAREAQGSIATPQGLVAPQFGVPPSRALRSSPLHDESGPAVVRCLIASARCDERDTTAALDRFLAVLQRPSSEEELFLGNAGSLVTAVTLYDALSAQGFAGCTGLEELIERELTALNRWIGTCNAIGREHGPRHLGMAHGWAGLLFAALTAGRILAVEPSDQAKTKLEELASFAEPIGRGLGWIGTVPGTNIPETPSYAPGWCSGSAGHLMLWVAAFEALGEQRWRDLAVQAGWHVWEHPDTSPNLCCGISGRAIGLLRLYRCTGDVVWRDRAMQLVESAGDATFSEHGARYSLFRGELGLALAALELERPSLSVMPFYEPEGWSNVQARPRSSPCRTWPQVISDR